MKGVPQAGLGKGSLVVKLWLVLMVELWRGVSGGAMERVQPKGLWRGLLVGLLRRILLMGL